jgi:hypothetical protein
MKKNKILITIALMVTIFFFWGCKKASEDKTSLSHQERAKVLNWLEKQKTSTNPAKNQTVQNLADHLDFARLRSEQSGNEETITVIPVKPGLLTVNNRNKMVSNYLVLFPDKIGGYRSGYILQYQPVNGQPAEVPTNTFGKFYDSQDLDCNGTFTTITVRDKFVAEVEYKDKGRLARFSEITVKDHPQHGNGNARSCIDWYWVTTYYYPDGSSYQTSEYFTTTCDGCSPSDPNAASLDCDNSGNGSGGGGGDTPIPLEKDTPNWIVAESAIGLWTVWSKEHVKGVRIPGYPNAGNGYFTGASHYPSWVINHVPGSGSNPLSVYQEMAGSATVVGLSRVDGNVTGRLTFNSGSQTQVSGLKAFLFQTMFP